MGWFQTATPGMSFNQSMTIPLELGLKSTASGPRLTFLPIGELRGLRKSFRSYFAKDLAELNNSPIQCEAKGAIELRVRFNEGVTGKSQFTVRGIQVVVDFDRKELLVHDHTAKLADVPQEELILYVDRHGLEVFASEGLCYLPLPMIASRDNYEVRIEVQNAKQIEELQVFELKSIWKP